MTVIFLSTERREDVVGKLEHVTRRLLPALLRTATVESAADAYEDVQAILAELDRIDAASVAYGRVGAARRAETAAIVAELSEASTPAGDLGCGEEVYRTRGWSKSGCVRRAASVIPGLGPRCRQHGDKAIASEAKNRQRDAERARHVEGHYTADELLVKASAEVHDQRYAAEHA